MIDLDKIKKNKTIKELIAFGIINVDKPAGPTSFAVSNYIKKILSVNKTSHFGTLDPQVTGVLPVALGRACRLSEYFMHRNKTYAGIMRLHEDVSDDILNETMKKFIGKINQLPPVKSRVKRAVREREIISFDITEREGKDAVFKTEVQAGTYIRKLIHDAGENMGGAHMLELRRTDAGMFNEADSHTLYELQDAVKELRDGKEEMLRKMIIPAESVSLLLPIIQIKKQTLKKCMSGSPLFPNFIMEDSKLKNLNKEDKFCAFCQDRFIGCYKYLGNEKIFGIAEFVLN